jgi:hypothetical protein
MNELEQIEQRKDGEFDEIKEPTTMQDKSPELKNGEIKQILIRSANEILPDFEFLAYKKRCYIFQRLRYVNELRVYETLNIFFSLQEKIFACQIASRLNPEYVFINDYNIGLINPCRDLKVLRHNRGILNYKDAYYFHDGQVETTKIIVNEIFSDYKKYGLPFLNQQLYRLKSNAIIGCGLEYIDNLQTDKENLQKEITKELNECELLLSRLKHPIYLDIKAKMRSISGQSKDDRGLIPKLSYELLELYWTR